MAIMWNGSLIPWLDENGAPYSGAKAYFFNAGTTTPRTVYIDAGLGESHDHPVLANGNGMFAPIFLPSGDYRLRIVDADDVTVWDVDGISVPFTAEPDPGGGGDTDPDLLFQTGDMKDRYATGTHDGWVRCNGRTIGDASSGATERANADCEDLFLHLWSADTSLTVTGGRGANAASDWAASKAIAVPDFRLRAAIGMASMGATASTRIPAELFDNSEDGDALGATVGLAQVTLTEAEMPEHDHTASSSTDGAHTHGGNYLKAASGGTTTGSGSWESGSIPTAGAHSHTITVQNAGGGEAHINVQPSMVVTRYIKL